MLSKMLASDASQNGSCQQWERYPICKSDYNYNVGDRPKIAEQRQYEKPCRIQEIKSYDARWQCAYPIYAQIS
jgi:hypothetical protein